MIEIYTVERCPKCIIIKGMLKKKEVKFKEIKLESQEQKDAFIEKFHVRTMPYMVVDGEVIGDAKASGIWIQQKYGV